MDTNRSQPALSVSELRTELKGRVIGPDDPEYDEARTVFLGDIDRRPAVIVKAAGEAEVSRVISLARENGLELAVRSGGHSSAGHSTTDGGLVLDLRDMKALDFDVDGRTAWAARRIRTSSGRSAAGAATSEWRPGSGSACMRWARSWAAS